MVSEVKVHEFQKRYVAMIDFDEYLRNHLMNSFVSVTTTGVPLVSDMEEIVAFIKYDENIHDCRVSFLYRSIYKNPTRALMLYSLCHPPSTDDNRFTSPVDYVPPVLENLRNMTMAEASVSLHLLPDKCRFTSVDFDLSVKFLDQRVISNAVNDFCDLVVSKKDLFRVNEFSYHVDHPESIDNLACLHRIFDTFGINLDCRLTSMHPDVADVLLEYKSKFAGVTRSLKTACFHAFLGIVATHGDQFVSENAKITIHANNFDLIPDATQDLAFDLTRRNIFNATEIRLGGTRRRQIGETVFYPLRGCPIVGYNVSKEHGAILAIQKFTRTAVCVEKLFGIGPGAKYKLKIKAKERVLFQWNSSHARFVHPSFYLPHILEAGEETTLCERIPFERSNSRVVFTYVELREGTLIKPNWMTREWAGKEVSLGETPFDATAVRIAQLRNPFADMPPGCALF